MIFCSAKNLVRDCGLSFDKPPYKQDVAGSKPAPGIFKKASRDLGSAPVAARAEPSTGFMRPRQGRTGWLAELSTGFKRHRGGRGGWLVERCAGTA
jgi:hypothetical protein